MPINTNTRPATIAYPLSNERKMAEAFLANAWKIGNVLIGLLPLDLMMVDYSYQRPTKSRVQKIATDFNPNKCGFLLVSYREPDGKFAIIDGGNRFEAAKLIGLPSLPCQILTDLSVEEEALVFAAQNDNRTRLDANDLLKAQVCAGNESAVGFWNLCNEFGIRLCNKGAAVNTLACIHRARKLYKENVDALRWVFSMIGKANWNTVQKGYSIYTITALFSLYRADAVEEIESKLVPIMLKIAPAVLLAKAEAIFFGRSRVEAMTALMGCIVDGTAPMLIAEA